MTDTNSGTTDLTSDDRVPGDTAYQTHRPDLGQVGSASLAAELFAVWQGVSYVRTQDVAALGGRPHRPRRDCRGGKLSRYRCAATLSPLRRAWRPAATGP